MRYLRPKSVQEAVSLLDEGVPLGGGTTLTPDRANVKAVIDLRELGLDEFSIQAGTIALGATLTLQAILDNADHLPAALIDSIRHEAAWNLRNAATLAGTLAAADGRSPALTALIALDGVVKLEPGARRVDLHDFMSQRAQPGPRYLITGLEFQMPIKLAYAQVARTPMDRPMVCASAALGKDGDIRLVLGGIGDQPIRLIEAETRLGKDQDVDAARRAAEAAFKDAGDAFAGAAYRSHTAGVLIERVVREVRA